MPSHVVAAAQARGRARDRHATVQELLEELRTSGKEAIRLRGLLRDFRLPIDIVVVGQAFADRYWDVPGSVLYPAFREGRVLFQGRIAGCPVFS